MKAPVNFSDKVAYRITMFLRWIADTFFKKRYGHRAVVLETVAGVPGMVAGMWNHLRSLRKMKPDDRGWIKTLLAEAENERMHLMIFIEIAKPNWFERWMIILAQALFWHFYLILYIFCSTFIYFFQVFCITYAGLFLEVCNHSVGTLRKEYVQEHIKMPKYKLCCNNHPTFKPIRLCYTNENHKMHTFIICFC